ncbi:hypothetical protein HK100_008712, partial [Physocladia obscura]
MADNHDTETGTKTADATDALFERLMSALSPKLDTILTRISALEERVNTNTVKEEKEKEQQKESESSDIEGKIGVLVSRIESALESASVAAKLTALTSAVDTLAISAAGYAETQAVKLSQVATQQMQVGAAWVGVKQRYCNFNIRDALLNTQSTNDILDTQENNHLELLHKVSILESQLEMLPQIYMETFTNSLQRQTSSLMGVMDGIVREQTDALRDAAVTNSKRAYNGLPDLGIAASVKDHVLPAVQRVPDLGIAK